MVTVTFPARAPSALQPDLPPTTPSDAGGKGFAEVFGVAGAGPGGSHSAKSNSPSPQAEGAAPPGQPVDETGQEPKDNSPESPTAQGDQAALQSEAARLPVVADILEPGIQMAPDSTISTQEGASMLQAIMLAAGLAAPAGLAQATDIPIGIEVQASNARLEAAVQATANVPALSVTGQGTSTGTASTFQVEVRRPVHGLTDAAAPGSAPPVATPSGPAAIPGPSADSPSGLVPPTPAAPAHALSGSAPTGPDASGLAPTGQPPEGETVQQTGLFVLAEPKSAAGRTAGIAAGVPAYWAAREVADAGPAVTDTPELQNQITLPAAPLSPKPAVMSQPDGDAAQPGQDEALALREAKARGASVPLTTFAPGPGQIAPVQQMPQGGTPQSLPPQVPAQIAAALAARPERPLELRLAPMELGGLTVNLRQDGDILRVVVQADRPDTLDLLRRNSDLLLEELRLSGFAGAALSFGDGGSPQGQQTSAPARLAHAADPALPLAPLSPTPALQTAQGLDLRL